MSTATDLNDAEQLTTDPTEGAEEAATEEAATTDQRLTLRRQDAPSETPVPEPAVPTIKPQVPLET